MLHRKLLFIPMVHCGSENLVRVGNVEGLHLTLLSLRWDRWWVLWLGSFVGSLRLGEVSKQHHWTMLNLECVIFAGARVTKFDGEWSETGLVDGPVGESGVEWGLCQSSWCLGIPWE